MTSSNPTAHGPREGPAKHEDSLPERFTVLWRAHHAFVWRCARRLGASEAELDDVVQETFLVVLRRLDDLDDDGPEHAPTWLFAILRNVMRNRARGRQRHARKVRAVAMAREHLQADRLPEATTTRGLARGLLVDFLASLDEDRRAVYVLAEFEGASSREIGESLGISPNTARSRLRAARAAFDARFDEEQGGRALAAERRRPGPSASRRRTSLQAIAASHAATGGLALTGGGATALGLSGWVTKLGLPALLAVGMIGAGVALRARTEQPSASTSEPAAPVASVGPTRAADPGPTEATPPPDPDAKPETIDPISVIAERPPPRPREPGDANEALAALAEARAALVDGRARQSLERLAEIDRWPDPTLARRALGTRVSALCALERAAEAREAVERWQRDAPDDPLPEQLRRGCW